ncbi:MAG: DNA-directed RNA polymerase subunit beta', partial [Deltaproteobacteria bacterium]|nr:DNA-directed RNA polymerase subunit beta' [Deltaproteobacteria bacterium]
KKKGKEETHTTASFNPIFMMAHSGSRGSQDQIRQLAGMRGLMAKPSGEIIETPITANFREGLSVLQYFTSTHGARKGLADTALKTANSGYLTRRLVDVAQDCIVAEEDCGTLDGVWLEALREGGEVIQPLPERILGRVALMEIKDPVSGEVLIGANEQIDEEAVAKIEEAGIDRVLIRSVLTCRAKQGVCAMCYGRDLAHGKPIDIGEAVGIIAAQSIGEPGTQLTMRTFHIGGTASRRVEASTIQARIAGKVKFDNLTTVVNQNGEDVTLNRNGQITLIADGRIRERHQIVQGTVIKVKDGKKVEVGQLMAEWDPYTVPILSDVSGKVVFEDIVEGQTMQERVDPVTGMASKVILEARDPEVRPQINIVDKKGKILSRPTGPPAQFPMPAHAILMVVEGDEVFAGDAVARIPRETTKTKDITGGLPRVAELFEVRKPKEHAVISEIDGIIEFGKPTKGKRKVLVKPDVGDPQEYLIPKNKHIIVGEGEYVRAGEPLMDGSANPHDILAIRGIKELARYLVDEVQEVYRLQGVRINDKHVEIIVRQMLRKVQIKDAGETNFLMGEQVERYRFEEENERVMSQGGTPAVAEPLLLGITKASLSTESFISAASFQETTKVLTEASIAGKVDNLKGLKENVIMGRLIPAGTGFREYRRLKIAAGEEVDEGDELLAEELL